MRTFILLMLVVSSLPLGSAADMKQVFATWLEESSASSANDAAMLEKLKQEVTKAYPDPVSRINKFFELAIAQSHDEKFTQTARLALAALWRDIVPKDIRSEFLAKKIVEATTENELRILRYYLKADLPIPAFVNDIIIGKLEEPVGCRAERFLTTENYRTSDGSISSRIVSLLYELAPASVVLDLSEIGDKREVADLVQIAESARHRFENAEPADEVVAWEYVQSVLRRMLEMNNPALDGYVARIMAWRKNGPSLSNDPSIINTLNARNDPVVKYLLSGKGLMSLLEIELSQPALLKTARSVKKQAASNGKFPLLTLSPTLAKAPETKPAPPPTEKPSSTPWSIIVVLILAALGLLWLLLKRRS